MGDSLTAGYGVAREEAWPGLLEADLKTEGISLRVRNAGTSGLTSAGALEALSWQLSGDIRILFLAIGANDGLRGLDLGQSRKNISSIVREAQARGVHVVLAGMKIPPNYGPVYAKNFEAMYVEIAREHRLKLMPFLLEGVAGRPRYNLEDGIHPNAEGHRLIAGNVLAFLKKEKVLR
ncbi:MAG: arylesterase [Elusimicrobia bacterium]|nr:arylesterase [Elusimicrobiota bacterium]